jgi:hypothetical protein
MNRMISTIALLLLTAPVWAGSCPALISQIDAHLETNGSMDQDTREQVKELRDEGQKHHQAGRHAEAMQTLNEALAKLDGDEQDS